ncbi:MAG: 50S ribosome-binding GTPase [Desulfurococcaceae archaeon]|nr:50S ribosome-binding GTPase [Desulfurococcaceae archaeon]
MKGAVTSPGGIVLASWGQISSIVSKADIVLHVLDARDPLSTFSKKLTHIVEKRGKRLVIVLNKSDLVPRPVVEEWKKYFEVQGYPTVYIAAARHMGTLKLRRVIKRSAPVLPTVVAVAGYPKVGKSSIINALKGKHSAPTSPYPGSPGYTRHFQLYRVDKDILVIDTPGILPVEGDEVERLIRGYPPEKMNDPVKPAVMLIERILKENPHAFLHAYRIESTDPMRILEELAVRRGWFYRTTREPLIEEAARAVIRDYHDGKVKFYIRPPSTQSIRGDESSGY